MPTTRDAALLRIHASESHKAQGRPLFEAVVLLAREAGLAGATVLRGPLGFGRSTRLHTQRILDLSADLPVVVEIVDAPERIDAFLPRLAPLAGDALVTVERVRVVVFDESDG